MKDLERRHLAELHALAARLGVPRYRMLRRDELIAALEGRHLAELHALAAREGVPRYRMLRREQLLAALGDRAAGR